MKLNLKVGEFTLVEEETKGDPRMKKAYEASSKLLRKRLEKERPEDLEL